MTSTLVDRVAHEERSLLRGLTAGATLSAVVGTKLVAWAALTGRPNAAAFARQTVTWAAIDVVIALATRRGIAHPPVDDDDAAARARRLRNLTATNAVLDVGYIGVGIALTRWNNPKHPTAAADGAAVIVQGAFLLGLDALHASRFHRLLT